MTPQKYRCPNCGKMVTFGEHFCLVDSSNENSSSDTSDVKNKPEHSGSLKKVGVVLVVATLTGAMLWPFLGIFAMFAGLIILAIIAVILSLISRSQNNGGSYYRKLLTLTGGRKDVAERLISAEEKIHPSFTRAECVRRVYDRLEYEHQR